MADGHAGSPAVYRVTMSQGQAQIAEGGDGGSDAQLSGTAAAWIQALAPVGDRNGLSSSGDHQLAAVLLDMLSLGQGREAIDVSLETAAG